jgi:hypothetical protein
MKRLLITATTAFLVLMAPAFAVDLEQHVKNVDGSEIVGPDSKPLNLTMATAITNALLGAATTNETEKGDNYRLAVMIAANSKNYSPSADDVIRIRKALGATQATLVYGQIMATLDAAFAASVPAPKK